ncbi:MAG TPA: type II and III secretion system protein [Burkholderiales bacterium]|nr:type II and III secretion system protein [Burkholderiales bacterium]
MGHFRGVVARGARASTAIFILALAGCGQTPLKPSPAHIQSEAPPPPGTIPQPVQVAPLLPAPAARPRPETYSVVVNNVPVHDLLFALARDAKLNVDIYPGLSGTVTLNAIDQTLPELLERISRQVDMRYQLEGGTLTVMRDTPYLRVYRIDYVNLSRDTISQTNLSTQVSGTGAVSTGAGGASATQNNSTSIIRTVSNNKFWDTLVANVKDLLRETDKIIPVAQQGGAAAAAAGAAAAGAAPAATGGAPAAAASQAARPAVEFREAASVIANPEAGVLSIRATSRQHAKVQEFLDQVMASAKRQVLIEATVAEVQLNNQYQRGIDWQRLLRGSGFGFSQASGATPAGINTNAFVLSFGSGPGLGLSGTLKLLESFGDVRVLSSPKVSVLNNQTAILKVVDNLVYFTVQANTVASANAPAVTTFTTTPNSVPVGFIMSVVPQISENDTVLLDIRPTVSRKLTDVADPNPSLANPCGLGVNNCSTPAIASLIPVIQTREMESVMRVQSGQTAVLGGLIQDSVTKIEDQIPGVRSIPGIGQLLEQRKDLNQKTELVIFLRPIVIRDPSIEGDYSSLRELVPGNNYFLKPNPSKAPDGK